jgi:NADPH-dependent glutamate synthase beta subunit-like oxidoreductase/coenzyme F420-reducing hydrogenase delta subunit/Pyruvate/2-oxoacid:ferredoxin oxidoreductase delta subunit
LHMDIGEYVDLTAQGKVMEALQVIRTGNPFPSICAHVCTHPCEDACRRAQVDKPVAIRALKRFAVEFGGDRMIRFEGETTRSEKVAVVGSGPGGLACAYYLRKLGYPVTVFEAHSELGGMLRVGIPQYRLPREVVDTEVQRLAQMGVEIRTNARVVSLDLLFDMGYRAVFLTIGAHQGLRMGVEGEESPGVIDGATFLREVNLGLRPTLGDRVGVVGGGNVAIDAARTALRLGVRQVNILYRRSRAEMPADEVEVQQAVEEGVQLDFLVAPIKIRRKNGLLSVTCTRMELGEPDASGRRRPVQVEGSEFVAEFDTLIRAIGQAPQMPGGFGVRTGRGSTIEVDPVTLTTNRVGVFAGGDAVTGPATVVQAMAAGRLASRRIDDYLQHRYPRSDEDTRESLPGELLPETVEMIRRVGRLEPPALAPEARTTDFRPVELVYDWDTAVAEARRCLRCGVGAEIMHQDKCASCLTCLRVCPYHVPRIDGTGTVQIPADQCQACGVCVAECPARAIVLRRHYDRQCIADELEHALKSVEQTSIGPRIIGFCCQYGLFGTGALAGLWRGAKGGIWIVPVLCTAKLEAEHMLRAFEMGAEGVFIAGCGEQCARENTWYWVRQRAEKARKMLSQVGIEPDRLQVFTWNGGDGPCAAEQLDAFVERIGTLYLASVIMQEVRR